MTNNKGFKILSLEAKDLYAAANLNNKQECGYSIRDKNGNPMLKKFEAPMGKKLAKEISIS